MTTAATADSDTAPTGTYVVEQLAADLADVLAALDVTGSLTLVGHSMGGMVALAYLGRPPADRPVQPHGSSSSPLRRVGSLSAAWPDSWPVPPRTCCASSPTRAPQRAVRLLTKPVRAALALQVGDHSRATLAALFDTAMAAASLTTAVGFLPSLRSYDQYATLASIRAQATILSGGADVLTPPSHARDLAAAIPGAKHVHLPMAGHMLPHEASHAVTGAINNTIASGIGTDPVPTTPVQWSRRRYSQPAMAA